MKRQSRKERKRSVILEAASALFSERDFHLVLMDDIAAHAGIGKGTLYRYFPTKDELYFATVGAAWDRVQVELEGACEAAQPPAANLEQMSYRILTFFWPQRHFIALLGDVGEHPEWRRRHEIAIRLVENELIRDPALALVPAGELRTVIELFLGMLRAGLLYHDDRQTPAVLARMVVKLLFEGVRSLATSARPRPAPAKVAAELDDHEPHDA